MKLQSEEFQNPFLRWDSITKLANIDQEDSKHPLETLAQPYSAQDSSGTRQMSVYKVEAT